MKSKASKEILKNDETLEFSPNSEDMLKRRVGAMFSLLASIYGPDKLVLKAGKLGALGGMRSDDLPSQVLALQKVVFEDPGLRAKPRIEEIPVILDNCQDEIADFVARQSVEQEMEARVSRKLQEKHQAYLNEIRREVLQEEVGPETPATKQKLKELLKLEKRTLSVSCLQLLRPKSLKEIVGQDRAIKDLLTKIASPYPQHVILYGPPGVGKTSVARLVLEEAKKMPCTPFAPDAPFIETDGATLRWDPREITNPLLGSVHDPIYQGARRDLAEGGIPEPKLGLVTLASGGVLFIDEIGEMDPLLQNKLLKVLEDKRVTFESSYYDPDDPRVPKYVKRLFSKGAPADFILIGATTREPEELSPALRSRCAEVFFDPLTPEHIIEILKNAAKKLRAKLSKEALELIADHTIEGRKAVGILADAFAASLYEAGGVMPEKGYIQVTVDHVKEAIRSARLLPYVTVKARDEMEVGRTFGLGVLGHVGSVLEVEAVAFPAKEAGKGAIRMNDTAGSMVKDSLFNAAAALRKVLGVDPGAWDIQVNIVGGAQVDGPSAGLAICLAVMSAVREIPLRQDVAVTGEVSLRGQVKAIGGVYEKIYGARQAGMKKVLLPLENAQGIPAVRGIEVAFVRDVSEALDHLNPSWRQFLQTA